MTNHTILCDSAASARRAVRALTVLGFEDIHIWVSGHVEQAGWGEYILHREHTVRELHRQYATIADPDNKVGEVKVKPARYGETVFGVSAMAYGNTTIKPA